MTKDLLSSSIEIIKENQSPTGAYVASPNFPTYQYCWFRDGSYIAYAMNLIGENESAAQFHDWVASTILNHMSVIRRAVEKSTRGEMLDKRDILHTRYTVNGEEANQKWPNFQLDGFGTWLWALTEYHHLSGQEIKNTWVEAAQGVARYLSNLWNHPCYDCWEEFPKRIHPYTLGAIFAGLQRVSSLEILDTSEAANQVSQYLMEKGVWDGRFVKFIGSRMVDANLVGLSVPFGIVKPEHPFMVKTVQVIEGQLRAGGGVRRYPEDTYYGGGEWILLTAWLGWYYAKRGDKTKARELQRWIEEQADGSGELPEQVPDHLNDPDYYQPWRERWGDIAKPLLWSHAKYIILTKMIEDTP